jgi:hypothetical protein
MQCLENTSRTSIPQARRRSNRGAGIMGKGCITQDLAFQDTCGKQGVREPFSIKLKDFGGMLVDTFSSGERTKPPGYFGVRVPMCNTGEGFQERSIDYDPKNFFHPDLVSLSFDRL